MSIYFVTMESILEREEQYQQVAKTHSTLTTTTTTTSKHSQALFYRTGGFQVLGQYWITCVNLCFITSCLGL